MLRPAQPQRLELELETERIEILALQERVRNLGARFRLVNVVRGHPAFGRLPSVESLHAGPEVKRSLTVVCAGNAEGPKISF